jgi:hypothetical protein
LQLATFVHSVCKNIIAKKRSSRYYKGARVIHSPLIHLTIFTLPLHVYTCFPILNLLT